MPSGCDDLYLSMDVSSTDTNTEDGSDDSSGDAQESSDNTEEINDVEDESTIEVERTEHEDNRREHISDA